MVHPFLFVSSKLMCSNDFGSSKTKINMQNQKNYSNNFSKLYLRSRKKELFTLYQTRK